MNIKHIFFSILSIITIFACKSPESVSQNYSELKASGDCESIILMSVGDARKTIVNSGCEPYDAVIVNKTYCETGKSSATCTYSENISYYSLDAEVQTTLKLVKMNGDWKISKENNQVTNITGGNDPKVVAEAFLKLLSEGKCEVAKMISVSTAKNRLTNQMENECNIFNLEILESKSEIINNSATYRTTEKRNFGRETKYVYNLVKTENEWRIIDYKKDLSDSPEGTTESFVLLLADGKCKEALEITAGNASQSVEASLASGCEAYESKIIGQINCVTENDKATCSCRENRDILGEMTFKYELEKVDGEWKVTNYKKDADFDLE